MGRLFKVFRLFSTRLSLFSSPFFVSTLILLAFLKIELRGTAIGAKKYFIIFHEMISFLEHRTVAAPVNHNGQYWRRGFPRRGLPETRQVFHSLLFSRIRVYT